MLNALYAVFGFSAFSLVYSYVFYPFLLGVCARWFGKPTKAGEMTDMPAVGVVVPAYNEEKVIEKKIRNILALDYPADKITVWVGSDQSTDRTNGIVSTFGDPRVRLWVAPVRGGKTEILNKLIPRVEADIILLTDANTMHRRESLRTLIRHFADSNVGGAAGHVEHQIAGSQGMEERLYRSFESRQKENESLLHSAISAFGGFYAIRKELFRPIPRNAYSNDDVLIPMDIIRQGRRMIFEPAAISEEDLTESIRMEFSRRVRIGAGNFQAFFWQLDFLNPFRGWPTFCYLSHKVTRWFSPLFMISGFGACIAIYAMSGSPAFGILALAGAAGIVAGLSFSVVHLRMLRPLYYFLSMNTALFLGFFRYIAGIKSAAWTHTAR
jgi:poly-beta-1,6-N-acetyl-D-glucosamine synthase